MAHGVRGLVCGCFAARRHDASRARDTGSFGSADLKGSKAGAVEQEIATIAVALFVGVRF
jgi:hypothetical protein